MGYVLLKYYVARLALSTNNSSSRYSMPPQVLRLQ